MENFPSIAYITEKFPPILYYSIKHGKYGVEFSMFEFQDKIF